MKSSPLTSRPRILVAMEGVLGGTLRHLDYLLRLADPEQWDIHLAVSSIRAPHVEQDFSRWDQMGWTVHRVPMRRSIDPTTDMQAFHLIHELCRHYSFDLVHTHCAKAGFLGRLAAFHTGIPAIHSPHVFPFTHVGRSLNRVMYRNLERLAARWSSKFVVLSNFQHNVAIDSGLASPNECEIIPNGIMPEDFQGPTRSEARRDLNLPPDPPLALFVGRFRPQKGLDVLLDAASHLKNSSSNANIVIVGEGPQAEWLNREIIRRRLEKRVSNHGYTHRVDLYYAACDVVVMPSRAEGMPYVALEAQAAGRPVAATLVSGMEGIVQHGKNGFLLPTNNPEALAHFLQNALSDRRQLNDIGQYAHDHFPREWHAEHMVQRTCQLWAQVIDNA